MRRKWKLLIAVLAVLALISSLIAGCQKTDGTTAAPTTAAAEKTTAAAKPAPESESEKATEAAPETDAKPLGEMATVIWYSGTPGEQTGSGPVYAELNRILAEKYNIQLDFRTFDWGMYDEKMNMIISSGENYDLCFTSQAWVNKYPAQVGKGAFLALDDYLPNYTALKEALPEFLFEQARINGKIYAVPNYQITYSQWGFLFRKDLIEESGFEYQNIKEYWEAEPFWQFVKENHPELFPTNATYGAFANVRNQYIPVGVDDLFFDSDDPDHIISMYLDKEESEKTGMGFWYTGLQDRKAWENGYLREDIATVEDQSADDAAGRFASISGVIKPGGEAERKKKSANYDWVQVGVQEPFTTSVASRSAMTAVNALSKHPEEALRMLEILNTDAEIFNMLNFGVEGTNYELTDEGKIHLIDESGYFYNAAWAIGNQFNAILLEDQEDGIWEATDKLNREAEITPINGFSFNIEGVTTEIANISAVKKEFENWQYEDDYETRYEEYVAKLQQAGIDTLIAEAQKQLDEWWESNKS